jgi:hypothetical protein
VRFAEACAWKPQFANQVSFRVERVDPIFLDRSRSTAVADAFTNGVLRDTFTVAGNVSALVARGDSLYAVLETGGEFVDTDASIIRVPLNKQPPTDLPARRGPYVPLRESAATQAHGRASFFP